MKVFHTLAIAGLLLAGAAPLVAQGRTVTGTVRSRVVQIVGTPPQVSLPIVGATVRVQGGLATVLTDASGAFRIEVPAGSSDILIVSHPEYDPAEVSLMGRSIVDVLLLSKVRYNQYGVVVDREPIVPETRDGLMVFESLDGQFRFWFDLRVNIDGAVNWDDELNANGSGAEVRRARLAIKSQFRKHWYGELDLDFADSRADLKDAFLMYSPNMNMNVRWGNYKEVFSMEQNTSSRYLSFMERPMVTKGLTPSRHLGMGIDYNKNWLFTAAGVHFQDVGGWEEVQLRKDNNADFGANEGYSLTGKVVVMGFPNDLSKGFHLGVAGSYRTPKTEDRIDAMRFDVRGPANVNRRKYVDTDRILNVDHSVHTNLEAAGYYRGARVWGEYTTAEVTRKVDSLGVAEFKGYYVAGSMMLFGGQVQYNTNDGEFTQPRLGRSWGDVELAARYEFIDLNSPAAGITGGSGEAFTLGLNLYPNNNVKFMVNYSIVNHDRFANGRGRLNSGLDANGVPTRDPQLVAQPDGKAGEDYKVLGVRVQVSF
jgi:phosphate-selective porin OprO/OprP